MDKIFCIVLYPVLTNGALLTQNVRAKAFFYNWYLEIYKVISICINVDKSKANQLSMQFWISTFLQSEERQFILQLFQMDESLHLLVSVLQQELNAPDKYSPK